MSDLPPSNLDSQFLSLSQTVEWLGSLSEKELYNWLARELQTAPPGASIHTFIAEVYRESKPSLQLRLSNAFADLLESFVPSVTPNKNYLYLYELLSLASNIRTTRVKERLRRWLYQDMFKDSEYLGDNLHGYLILASMFYDSDEEWLSHIKHTLPGKPFFPQVARHAYRALLDTTGINCLDLLPQVLGAIDYHDEDEKSFFGYLLEETVSRFDQELFLDRVAEALSAEWRVERVFANTLNLEEFLASAFRRQPKRLETLVKGLDARIWRPWANKWVGLDKERGEKAFTAIYDVCKPRIIDYFLVRDAIGALDFRSRHELVVPSSHTHLQKYFNLAAAAAGG
jgi:hypothetical protein